MSNPPVDISLVPPPADPNKSIPGSALRNREYSVSFFDEHTKRRVHGIFGRFTDDLWWDKNAPFIIRGTIVALGVTGIYRFVRSVHWFTRFHRANDIPERLIDSNKTLKAHVMRVNPKTGHLEVKHQPPLAIFGRDTGSAFNQEWLRVALAGIHMTEPAKQWLAHTFYHDFKQHPVVWFKLLARHQHSNPGVVQAEVFAKRFGNVPFVYYNVNQAVVRHGLARVKGTECPNHLANITNARAYANLIDKMIVSEQIADRRGVGIWRRENNFEKMAAVPKQVASAVTQSPIYQTGRMTVDEGRRLAVVTAHTGVSVFQGTMRVARATASSLQMAYHVIRRFVMSLVAFLMMVHRFGSSVVAKVRR